MERIPQGKYTPEFRAEAIKLAETGFGITAAAKRLSVPKSSLHQWVRPIRWLPCVGYWRYQKVAITPGASDLHPHARK